MRSRTLPLDQPLFIRLHVQRGTIVQTRQRERVARGGKGRNSEAKNNRCSNSILMMLKILAVACQKTAQRFSDAVDRKCMWHENNATVWKSIRLFRRPPWVL